PDQFFKSLETCRVQSGRSLGLEWRIASREPSARCFRRKLHAGIVPDLLRPSLAADSFRARVGAKSYPHGYPDARYFFFTSEPKTDRTCSDLRRRFFRRLYSVSGLDPPPGGRPPEDDGSQPGT